jgi:hypothetical protein
VGATLIAAVMVVLAIGLGWKSRGGTGSSLDDVAGRQAQGAAANGKARGAPGEIPPSQPAVPVSFGGDGEVIRPAPGTVRIIDPESGLEVVITLPPGTALVAGQIVPKDNRPTTSAGSGTTRPGTGTTGTTGGPTTTGDAPTSTSERTTTTSEETTTTAESTTTTTVDPNATTPSVPASEGGGLGGLLDSVVDLLTP